MSTFLWLMAFVGIAVIYAAKQILNFLIKDAVNATNINVLKCIGIALCIGSMLLLYLNGQLL